MVGAKGFEPSTSWSRTRNKNHLSRCPGVSYSFSGRSLLDKLVQVRTVLPNMRACQSAPLEHADIRAYELGRHFEWIRPQQTEHRPGKSGTDIPRS
jgi:hypothetical protein